MPVTARISYFGANASEPAGANAEGGIKYNRADSLLGTTPVPRPTSAGTNNSWVKQLGIEVTGTAATSLFNRTIRLGTALTTGLGHFFLGTAAYLDQTGGSGAPADDGSNNGATPSGYTATGTVAQTYAAGTVSGTALGRNGDFCRTIATVSNNYSGGAGSAISMPDIVMTYDEA